MDAFDGNRRKENDESWKAIEFRLNESDESDEPKIQPLRDAGKEKETK